jgi:sugar lactone lactonase YvrE
MKSAARWLMVAGAALSAALAGRAAEPVAWVRATAYKIPPQYTNQESGYFSIVEGRNGRLYIGAAKYGVDAYLIEFDPKTAAMRAVVDCHQVIGSTATGFAAQAKIHTRNNVGASGKIYFGTKQGYPEKGEERSAYRGGYVMTYDPAAGKAEHFGIPFPGQGVISVAPDEARGLAYVSTCSDERPVESSHFMVLDLKRRAYTDLGDLQHLYAFIVLDARGRAYHPIRGGRVARYDPETRKLERLAVTVDGAPPPPALTGDGTILNWEVSPDRKSLYAVEMTTNQLFRFDLTAPGDTLPGRRLGELLPGVSRTDCRAMSVGADGTVWAAVTRQDLPQGPELHLVSCAPRASAPRDHGPVAIANPDYTPFTDAAGKPLPWHHCVRKAPDGTLTPWVPMGICPARDGAVYMTTIAPFTLLRFERPSLR